MFLCCCLKIKALEYNLNKSYFTFECQPGLLVKDNDIICPPRSV